MSDLYWSLLTDSRAVLTTIPYNSTIFLRAAKTSPGVRSCEQASDSTGEKDLSQDYHNLRHS